MRGVVLDAASLGNDVDWQPIAAQLDDWQVFNETTAEQVVERIQKADITEHHEKGQNNDYSRHELRR